jgi:hypothetical protein
MGQGMTFFMEHQYENAEADFLSATQKHPELTGAKINLAMTLARLGRDQESLDQWRKIATDELNHLPTEQRQAVAAEIQRLQAVLAE